MTKIISALISIVFLLVFALSYNNLITQEENVSEAFSQIQSNIQRKADLLPNLVKIVKSYAQHERDTFKEVAQIRVNKMNLTDAPINKKQVEQMIKLNKVINQSTFKLFALAEQYPNLRASEQFLQLQAQVEGTENRINVTRMHYNTSVKEFNAQIRRFPSNLIASSFGFSKKLYFQASETAKQPIVLDL